MLVKGVGHSESPEDATRQLASLAIGLPVQATLGSELIERIVAMRRSIQDQGEFLLALAADPIAADTPPGFAALAGRDVVLIFVESYGRGYVDAPRFRAKSHVRLEQVQQAITEAGLYVRSGWIRSPIRGGRSWLAHGTFASGLALTNQARFDRLIASPRRSLNRLFQAAGWRTAGVMPAIQLAWPEGQWYGFDESFTMADLQYKGQKFGWVTMPDQYTLSAFESKVRAPATQPLMAEVALISSHVPWTPLPKVVPWEQVGDGSVFDGSQRFGRPVVWSDTDRVRDMYAQSLDYTLDVLGQYLVRHAANGLFIILGDHQPPSIINGWGKTADVPVHIVADDPELLQRLPAGLFSTGMLPAADLPSQPMESMRELLSRVFEQ
jgi:hypothetical protein